VTLIGRLAVDKQLRNRGVGAHLLMDALHRSLSHADEIAAMAVVVDAKDEAAAAFYRHYDFKPLQSRPRRLSLPMRTVETEPPAAYRDADHHAVSAVIKWVEQGVAPEKLIATRFVSGALVRSRPACPYPAEAVYNGSGDINNAANFSCKTPKLQDRTVTETDLVLIRNSLNQRTLMLPNRCGQGPRGGRAGNFSWLAFPASNGNERATGPPGSPSPDARRP